ncbi:MAG: ABC transporter permease [Cyclobacteriaceae bacterium]|nr:ABC transporter permease [Cyclobacteriaceae bacterium]
MVSNYFKIAFRYLVKNRTFTAINLLGLTLGFTCFLLLTLYVQDELSFDRFHHDADRIYRVLQHEQQEDGSVRDLAVVSSQIGPETLRQFADVEDVLRFSGFGRITMGNDPPNRQYVNLVALDTNFFTFFDFPIVEGDKHTMLSTPDAVILTESTARKYFGNQPAVGQSIWSNLVRRENRQYVEFTVAGVVKDFPSNSHLQFDVMFSEPTFPGVFPWYKDFVTTDWTSNSYVTYIKLKPGADRLALEKRMTEMTKAHYPANQVFRSTFSLQPLEDIHLNSMHLQGSRADWNGMNPMYLYLFGAVAFMILLIAGLNYMNLSTAAAVKRTREIGTRKTLGAQRLQLIGQFTGEAILLSGLSLLVAIALAQFILPFANSFTGKQLAIDQLPPIWMAGVVAAMILVGLLSALYPAYLIARVMPAQALKKGSTTGNSRLPMRKLLVAGQFAVSILMISSTLVIYQQLKFLREKDPGMSVSDLLVVDINSGNLRRNYEQVKAEFATVPEVLQVSTSTRVPGEWKPFPIARAKVDGLEALREIIYVGADQDFFSTYKIKLLKGRNFSGGREDSTKVILTQLAVEQLGLSDPIGAVIDIPAVLWGASTETLEKPLRAEVIGIADNFHFESFRKSMMPVMFAYPNTAIQRIDYYTLKIKTSDWAQTLEKLKAVNDRLDPENPLEYTFLNDRFQQFYQADEMRGQLFLIFSLVIVLIAVMGLFALVSYSMESRAKEIGVRKVLGASVQSILGMVSREFLLIVVGSSVIALPLSWWIMQAWLSDFAYRVPLNVGTFVLAAVVALIIAFFTISLRSWHTARSNPVESLRSE